MQGQQQQKVKMQENLGQLCCTNKHQNTEIEYIIKDNSKRGSERLLCSKCIEFFNNPPNLVYITKAKERIELVKQLCYNQTEKVAEQFIQDIAKYIENLRTLTSDLQKQINNLINQCIQWIDNLNYYKTQKLQYKFLDEIDNLEMDEEELIQQSLAFDIYEINSINENNDGRVSLGIQNVQQTIKKFSNLQGMAYKIIKNANNYEHFQYKKMKSITYQVSFEKKEDQLCNALAFNSDESLLATAADKNIKLWKFYGGELLETNTNLQGHIDQVVCLVFSQQENLLISGSKDETIKLWKEISQNKWQPVQNIKIDSSYSLSLVLNQNENQFIAGCFDGSIKIISFNNDLQTVLENYRLDRHTKPVYSISLNSKGNQFVSSSSDKQIIIWEKNNSQLWEFKYVVDKSINDVCYRISYFGDETILFQQKKNGQTHFLKMQNSKFVERSDLRLVLNNQDPEVECFFPIIYNQKNQVLVLKHSQYVYIIKENKLQYQVACSPIDCLHPWNYGTMTKDGRFLIIWEYATKNFKVYLLDY
ncbi:unnamed protein product [Paramecium primaurelia]|uniref:WD40-repeat-containing domain n=1 Tax=Paramecium primaurelia TaxID=5886 RepID=A0A8S1KS91_PARPR|nr:unnamed protein product [Paramecium primaurelia]